MKLAEALLRRKELQEKVARMAPINRQDMFENKVVRKNVTESVDDILASIAKVTFAEFSAEYNFYAHQLRVIDGIIQQANWTTEVVAPEDVVTDFQVK